MPATDNTHCDMYYVLYDRHLNSIGDTYILESWERTQRAYDFDDMKIVGETIPASADPFFVVCNDKRGKLMFSGLASTPVIDETTHKTTITMKDYMTLLNSDIVVDWSTFTGTKLSDLINFVLSLWKTQNGDIGFSGIQWDVSGITDIALDPDIPLGEDTESVLAYDVISEHMYYYEVWCEPVLDVNAHTLTYIFRQVGLYTVDVRLKDFGIERIEKSFGEYNKATVYSSSFVRKHTWVLTADNQVQRETENSALVYPVKNRNFIASDDTEEEINNALYDAVMGLAENRYQENFDLDIQQHKAGTILSGIDFSTSVRVYTDNGYYKTLPVGEIETNSDSRHIIKIGYYVQELTQSL